MTAVGASYTDAYSTLTPHFGKVHIMLILFLTDSEDVGTEAQSTKNGAKLF